MASSTKLPKWRTSSILSTGPQHTKGSRTTTTPSEAHDGAEEGQHVGWRLFTELTEIITGGRRQRNRPAATDNPIPFAAHNIFGVPHTINSANYVYFLGLQKILSLGHPDAVHIFTDQLLELHRGQGMDIYWRDHVVCPTEDEYRSMVKRKTGGLFGLTIRLMQLFSENKSDFSLLIDNFGLYFQIRDDYANLCSEEISQLLQFYGQLGAMWHIPLLHIHCCSQDMLHKIR